MTIYIDGNAINEDPNVVEGPEINNLRVEDGMIKFDTFMIYSDVYIDNQPVDFNTDWLGGSVHTGYSLVCQEGDELKVSYYNSVQNTLTVATADMSDIDCNAVVVENPIVKFDVKIYGQDHLLLDHDMTSFPVDVYVKTTAPTNDFQLTGIDFVLEGLANETRNFYVPVCPSCINEQHFGFNIDIPSNFVSGSYRLDIEYNYVNDGKPNAAGFATNLPLYYRDETTCYNSDNDDIMTRGWARITSIETGDVVGMKADFCGTSYDEPTDQGPYMMETTCGPDGSILVDPVVCDCKDDACVSNPLDAPVLPAPSYCTDEVTLTEPTLIKFGDGYYVVAGSGYSWNGDTGMDFFFDGFNDDVSPSYEGTINTGRKISLANMGPQNETNYYFYGRKIVHKPITHQSIMIICANTPLEIVDDKNSDDDKKSGFSECELAGYVCTSAERGCGHNPKYTNLDCGSSSLTCCKETPRCGDGVCFVHENKGLGETPETCPQDCGTKEEKAPKEQFEFDKSEIDCTGCLVNGKCFDVGVRKDARYCGTGGYMVPFKDGDLTCENGFECASGICANDQCVSAGTWKKFINWLSWVF
ncbi:hypothetical protein JXA48_04595 [Candidatus Woesearchaeota archaeon]|nr:hypothetical protein [Candidatus Woesearchaeota archaeon]